MRKIVLAIVCLHCFVALHAQEKTRTFKPFKLDFAYGRAFPFQAELHSGGLFSIEPKYALNDHITLGARFEFANLGPTSTNSGFLPEFNLTTSQLLTVDYYFNTNNLRPFAGLGAGAFSMPVGDDPRTDMEELTDKFGFTPRGGIETRRFRAALEWNVIGKTTAGNFSYISIKAGFFLGGKRIQND